MKVLKVLLVVFFLFVVSIVLVIGYLGFIPGVSSVMGSDKPRDLGMTYSQESYDNALAKAQTEVKELPANSVASIQYEGSHSVKESFASEELTAHAYNKTWVHYPISQVQVRINDDDTCEVSGLIDLTKVDAFLNAFGISQGDYKKALEKANIPMKTLPFYAMGSGTAKDGNLNIDVSKFEIGRFSVPANYIAEYKEEYNSFGEMVMGKIDGFSVNEAYIDNGQINFDGTLPDKELTKR
ncbi:hypothetical protein IPM62_05570 [Candidatus Woesebacteria bacterium]|nr:MAG: hypothetical protein IPM62_05570 [Candidatus Woesebacteria bacterium]